MWRLFLISFFPRKNLFFTRSWGIKNFPGNKEFIGAKPDDKYFKRFLILYPQSLDVSSKIPKMTVRAFRKNGPGNESQQKTWHRTNGCCVTKAGVGSGCTRKSAKTPPLTSSRPRPFVPCHVFCWLSFSRAVFPESANSHFWDFGTHIYTFWKRL